MELKYFDAVCREIPLPTLMHYFYHLAGRNICTARRCCMSAVAEEDDVAVEDRVAKLESDVGHLRSDLGEMKLDLREVKLGLRSLRTEVSVFKTEVAAEFGRVRTAIE